MERERILRFFPCLRRQDILRLLQLVPRSRLILFLQDKFCSLHSTSPMLNSNKLRVCCQARESRRQCKIQPPSFSRRNFCLSKLLPKIPASLQKYVETFSPSSPSRLLSCPLFSNRFLYPAILFLFFSQALLFLPTARQDFCEYRCSTL